MKYSYIPIPAVVLLLLAGKSHALDTERRLAEGEEPS